MDSPESSKPMLTLLPATRVTLYSWKSSHIGALRAQPPGTGVLRLVPEPKNDDDKYAIQAHGEGGPLGYLPRRVARVISKLIDVLDTDVWVHSNVSKYRNGGASVTVRIPVLKELRESLRAGEALHPRFTRKYLAEERLPLPANYGVDKNAQFEPYP